MSNQKEQNTPSLWFQVLQAQRRAERLENLLRKVLPQISKNNGLHKKITDALGDKA